MTNKISRFFYIVVVFLILFSCTFLMVACGKNKDANISFNSNGGSLVEATQFSSLQELPVPTKDGYSFVGWFFDNETFNNEFTLDSGLEKDTNLFAKWAIKTYTVTFVGQGGICTNGVAVQTVEHGKVPTTPTFVKNGYNFVGFDKKIVEATSDFLYNASFAPNIYTLTLEDSIEKKELSVSFGNILHTTITAPQLLGSNFGGYYSLPFGDGNKYLDENMQGVIPWDKSTDTTLYAKWYSKITFDKQQGTGGSDCAEAVFDREMPLADAPKRPFYTFLGYFTEPNGEGAKYYDENMSSVEKWKKTSDITLYAHYEETEYNISFDKKDGAGGSDFVKVKYGQTLPNALTPTKAGYKFLGYYSHQTSGIMYYDGNMVSETVWNNDYGATVFARWELLEGTKGFSFEYTEKNTYKITGYIGEDTDIVIPSTYKNVKVGEIADNAFLEKYQFVNVVVPLGVTRIGENAFRDCISLKLVTLPSNLIQIDSNAFNNCISLESISLPDSLKTLEQNSFYGCSNLKNISFGNGMENIKDGSFYGCLSLTKIVLPQSLTHIGSGVFSQCYYLEDINLPTSLLYIGESAFYQCMALTNVIFPNKLLFIGDSAFELSSINNITLPSSLVYLGHSAFNSTNTHNVFMESQIPFAIGKNVFTEDVYIIVDSDSIASYQNSVGWEDYINFFSPEDIDENGLLLKNNVLLSYTGSAETIVVPSYIVNITDCAFMGVNGKITFEENSAIASIGEKTFYLYKGKEILLPDSIISINGNAFDTAINLEIVALSSNLVDAGTNLFKKNLKLKNVYLNCTTTPKAEGEYNYSGVNLYVPEVSKSEYESHPFWGRFRIIAIINE